VGSMSLAAALTDLLAGTGFSYQISGVRCIAVFLRQKNMPAAPATGPRPKQTQLQQKLRVTLTIPEKT
jgi:hypothetical protein